MFPCSVEYMTIKDTDIENLYCGSRVPFIYYSQNSTVYISFISDIRMLTKGNFKIFCLQGKQVWNTEHIFRVLLTDQKHILSNVEHEETQFLYFTAHRLHIIHMNISTCWSSSHLKIYDGPGIKSPVEKSKCKSHIISFYIVASCVY